MTGMEDELPTVSLRLWRADAIVLFDWLAHIDLNTCRLRIRRKSRPWLIF